MPKRPGRKSSYFWQGLLIVLPAILLAGLGFYSLRLDPLLPLKEVTALRRRPVAAITFGKPRIHPANPHRVQPEVRHMLPVLQVLGERHRFLQASAEDHLRSAQGLPVCLFRLSTQGWRHKQEDCIQQESPMY